MPNYGLSLIRPPSPTEVGVGLFPTYDKAKTALFAMDIPPHPYDLWLIEQDGTPVAIAYWDDRWKLILKRRKVIKIKILSNAHAPSGIDYRYGWNVLYSDGTSADVLSAIFHLFNSKRREDFLHVLLLDSIRRYKSTFDSSGQYILTQLDKPIARKEARKIKHEFVGYGSNGHLTNSQHYLFTACYRFLNMKYCEASDRSYYFDETWINLRHASSEEELLQSVHRVLSFTEFMGTL